MEIEWVQSVGEIRKVILCTVQINRLVKDNNLITKWKCTKNKKTEIEDAVYSCFIWFHASFSLYMDENVALIDKFSNFYLFTFITKTYSVNLTVFFPFLIYPFSKDLWSSKNFFFFNLRTSTLPFATVANKSFWTLNFKIYFVDQSNFN